MYLIDYLHQHDIGVILDWVPSHFLTDEHGLGYFDGTHLYEHADPRQGVHPDWNTLHLQLRPQRGAQLSLSAAPCSGSTSTTPTGCASMPWPRCCTWTTRAKRGSGFPIAYGGRENLDAIAFLRKFNELVYRHYPDVMTIAEESTAWPKVSRPVYDGGLGFGYKWDMGWMHDTLEYLSHDPIHRKHHHNQITFRSVYAFSENFVLPLVARRSGARQAIAAGKNARRRLAEVRQPAAAFGLHVRAARQEAAVHGRRIRPAARMEPRRPAGLAAAGETGARGRVQVGRGPESTLQEPSRRCTSAIAVPRVFNGSTAATASGA